MDEVAELLPAQGPITVFIHHNTLHAFEDSPFEDAVVEAAARLGCEPFLAEADYRQALASGRISRADVAAVLEEELGARSNELVALSLDRFALRERLVLFGMPDAAEPVLGWLLSETSVLERFREDLPSDARDRLAKARDPMVSEEQSVRALWEACTRCLQHIKAPAPGAPEPAGRHRDALLLSTGVDTDEEVHPLLIRFVSAFLDQGLASWSMPDREQGLRGCFHQTYGGRLARLCGAWARELPELIERDRGLSDALESIGVSLRELGVVEDEWRDYLLRTALALRGWAGMVRQIEERPDRVPTRPVPSRLADFLAVRLLLERAALGHAARVHLQYDGPLADLREHLRAGAAASSARTALERAWALFHLAQLCGWDAEAIEGLSADAISALERELQEQDSVARRRVLHLAFERHLRNRAYDVLASHTPETPGEPVAFQAIFCLDEREESFRRHLEEVEPRAETFGAAGFFGVAIYFQGESDARPRPLCPVVIRPEHFVAEERSRPQRLRERWRRLRQRGAAVAGRSMHVASRRFLSGAVVTSLFGALAIVPLIFRVLFPRLSWRFLRPRLVADAPTQLLVARQDEEPPVGRVSGFTAEEMAAIVRGLLTSTGLVAKLSDLILVLGHGSASLNNPQESAYNCGACGGGRGGPNARAFALMANDPEVRRILDVMGIGIPDTTWFVGGERNTCNNAVTFFDVDRIPPAHEDAWQQAHRAVDKARGREARERCRRFDGVPAWLPPRLALMHVEGRAVDLAQPRPEYGHATNALCIIGRRQRSRGIFFDRRAFLVSYDPGCDADGSILASLLAAVVPVVAGINLEYFFSRIDPTGYGCGTKLPHNVTSLLGVMDGAQSDLRTGLNRQMVEIHEAVRLSIVIECRADHLRAAIEGQPMLERLVRNRWFFVARLDPDSGAIEELGMSGLRPYVVEQMPPAVRGDSRQFARAGSGHLAFTRLHIEPARATEVQP